jgi:hypothetical protein
MSTQGTRGNIITTAARILATESRPMSIADDPHNFEYFAENMISDPVKDNGYKNYDPTTSSIGLYRDFCRDFPSGRQLFMDVAMLNESSGLMKPFAQGEPGEYEIGIIDIAANDYHRHKTRMQKVGHKTLGTYMHFSANILNTGRLFMNNLDIGNACKNCRDRGDLSEEIKVLSKIGMSGFFERSGMSDELFIHNRRYAHYGKGHVLDEDEAAALAAFITTAFAQGEK